MLLFMQPRTRLALWAASAHCRLMSSLSSIGTPKSLSAELLSILSLYWYWGLPRPRCRTLHLAMLNLMGRHGGVGQMVGLDDLTGLFQPMILWLYSYTTLVKEKATLTKNSLEIWMAFINNITRYFVIGVLLTWLILKYYCCCYSPQEPILVTRIMPHWTFEQVTKHTYSRGDECKK